MKRDDFLFRAGTANFILFLVALALTFVDDRTILGIDPWIKPAKFFVSIAIYLWTLALLMPLVERRGAVRFVPMTITVVMIGEMVGIVTQSIRGVPSHFNVRTGVDSMVFSLMGMLILINTIAVLVLLAAFFRAHRVADRALLWAIRLGLFVFTLGGLEAVFMLVRGSHTVGAPDGGPGLPLVNWSTQHGDLRIAHFLGLHALQLLPLAALVLARWGWPERRRVAAVFVFAIVYFGVVAALVAYAMAKRPLISL